jgi:GNAT superfamily N-acetyltransferase
MSPPGRRAKIGTIGGATRTSAGVVVATISASNEHVAAITALINRAFLVEKFFIDRDRITEAAVRELMSKGVFLLAGTEAPLAGCVYVEVRGALGYFGLLSVNPDLHRRGLGRQLIAAAEDYARRRGCTAMEIRVVNLRTELPPIYRSLGYAETRIEPFPEVPKVPCHFIVMQKPLTPSVA